MYLCLSQKLEKEFNIWIFFFQPKRKFVKKPTLGLILAVNVYNGSRGVYIITTYRFTSISTL